MRPNSPSLTQRLVVRLIRSRAAEIERESREWLIICPNCGLERSYWDIVAARLLGRETLLAGEFAAWRERNAAGTGGDHGSFTRN
jgi:hypothetical protein